MISNGVQTRKGDIVGSMRMPKDQSGITIVLTAILFTFIVAGGFTAYRVVGRNNSSKPGPRPVSTLENETASPTPLNNQPQTNQQGTGILSGQVTCTQLNSQEPCSTRIEIENTATDSRSGSYMQPIIVDASGKFSIELAPGSYKLAPERKAEYPMFIPPFPDPVEIKAGHTTAIKISYHDGLRSAE